MKPMTYKGYMARIEYSDEDQCFIGHIAGIHDVVGFHGDSVARLRTAFIEAVDDYVAACQNLDVPRKNLTLENLYYVSLLKFTRSLQCKRKSLEKLESMGCGSACRSCACLKQIEQLKIAYTNGVVAIKSTAKPMQRRSHGLSMRLSM